MVACHPTSSLSNAAIGTGPRRKWAKEGWALSKEGWHIIL